MIMDFFENLMKAMNSFTPKKTAHMHIPKTIFTHFSKGFYKSLANISVKNHPPAPSLESAGERGMKQCQFKGSRNMGRKKQ